jgi:hypothetical protein
MYMYLLSHWYSGTATDVTARRHHRDVGRVGTELDTAAEVARDGELPVHICQLSSVAVTGTRPSREKATCSVQ